MAWEDALLSLEDGYVTPNPRYADEVFTVASWDQVRRMRDEERLASSAHQISEYALLKRGMKVLGRLSPAVL